MKFDTETSNFGGSFFYNSEVTEPTVVFVSQEYWYPDGYDFLVTDSEANELDST